MKQSVRADSLCVPLQGNLQSCSLHGNTVRKRSTIFACISLRGIFCHVCSCKITIIKDTGNSFGKSMVKHSYSFPKSSEIGVQRKLDHAALHHNGVLQRNNTELAVCNLLYWCRSTWFWGFKGLKSQMINLSLLFWATNVQNTVRFKINL